MGEQSRPVLVFLQTSGAMYAQTLLKRGGGEGTALNTMTPSLLYPTVAHKVSQSDISLQLILNVVQVIMVLF